MEVDEETLNTVLILMECARKTADFIDNATDIKNALNITISARQTVDTGLLKACLYGAKLSGEIDDHTYEEISELNQGTSLKLDLSDQRTRYYINQKILYEDNKEYVEKCLKLLIETDNIINTIDHNAPSISRYFYMGAMMALCIVTLQVTAVYDSAVNEFIDFVRNNLELLKYNLKLAPLPDNGNDDEYLTARKLISVAKTIYEDSQQHGEFRKLNNDNNGENETEDESLETLMNDLDDLVGLQSVKDDLHSLINLVQITKIREERGYKQEPMSLHMVFSGNPGTGKTTVARLLAKIYKKIGILSKGQLIEVDRADLVGGYVGQTALKVKEVLDKSLGGILFIDEAYSLTSNKEPNDYGHEAIGVLLKGMEDHRDDLIVIAAGYPKLMDDFLNSNPGLRSRFNKIINFPDYSASELLEIFLNACDKNGLKPDDECTRYVSQYFNNSLLNKEEYFGNARLVRNFVEKARVNQANRISTSNNISNEVLETLILDDVKNISI